MAVALARNTLPQNPRWKDLTVVKEKQAAEMAADLCAEYHLSAPENESMRMAWEHLMALATESSERKVTQSAS